MSEEVKLPLPEPLRSIGKKWIDYAQEERDPNDIAFAIWSALHEAAQQAQTAPVVPEGLTSMLLANAAFCIEMPDDKRTKESRQAIIDKLIHIAGEMQKQRTSARLSAAPSAPANSEDAKRLDWLEQHCTGASDSERYLPFRVYWGADKNIRKALDKAIAATAQQKEGE